jgi:PAS domain-containing protein
MGTLSYPPPPNFSNKQTGAANDGDEVDVGEQNRSLRADLSALLAHDAVVELDAYGTVQRANDRFGQLSGHFDLDGTERAFSSFWEADGADAPSQREVWRRVEDGRTTQLEGKLLGTRGESRARFTFLPVTSKGGRLQKAYVRVDVIDDGAAGKLAAVHGAAVHSAPTALVYADASGNVSYVNPAAVSMLRRAERALPSRPEQLVGSPFERAFPGAGGGMFASNGPRTVVVNLGAEVFELFLSAIVDEQGKNHGSCA